LNGGSEPVPGPTPEHWAGLQLVAVCCTWPSSMNSTEVPDEIVRFIGLKAYSVMLTFTTMCGAVVEGVGRGDVVGGDVRGGEVVGDVGGVPCRVIVGDVVIATPESAVVAVDVERGAGDVVVDSAGDGRAAFNVVVVGADGGVEEVLGVASVAT